MKKRMLYFCFGIAIIGACKQQVLENSIDYQPFIPKNFPTPIYDLTTNPISKEGFELGRKLFYDPILSLDSTISCGNCHQQSAGFTQHGHDISHGFKDRLGTRNAQPIMNLLWNQNFFWDGGVHQLDFVPINAITSPVEMAETLEGVVEKLQRHPQYPAQFKTIFGNSEITSAKMLKALSQFMNVCVSANSKYDKFIRKEVGGEFTAQEKRGLNIFRKHCESCHKEPLFTNDKFENNGLALDPILKDWGRMKITQNPKDSLKFKVPTLRNIQYSKPFFLIKHLIQ